MADKSTLPALGRDLLNAVPLDIGRINFDPRPVIPTIRDIVGRPDQCWEIIKSDTRSLKQIFEQYVFALAAIPAVSGLIGYSIFGFMPESRVVELALVGYLFSILFMFGAVFLAQSTAKLFDGEISPDQSGKLVVFSLMPYFAAGIFLLCPLTAPLALLGSLSFYVFFTGVKTMTRVPEAKRFAYALINVVSWVVVADFMRVMLF